MPLISQLPSTVVPNRTAELATEREGLSNRYSIAQLLSLLLDDDLLIAMPELSTYGSKLDATVINALTAKATLVDADQFAVRDSVSGLMRKHTYAQLKTLLAAVNEAKYPRFDAAAALSVAQRQQLGANIGLGEQFIGLTRLSASAADVVITGLADYINVRAVGLGIPVSAGGSICIQYGLSGGTVFLNGANAYVGEAGYFAGGGVAASQTNNNVNAMNVNGIPASFLAQFESVTSNFNKALTSYFDHKTVYNNGGGSFIIDRIGGSTNSGVTNATAAFDSLRLFSNVGQLAANSYIAVFGIKG